MVKELQIENQSLLAEVEIYRKEAALPSFSKMALGQAPSKDDGVDVDDTPDDFIKSGNGVFPSDPVATLKELHSNANPLCCALHPNDTLLATGGADRGLTICQWGGALAPTPGAAENVVKQAVRIPGPGPVICVSFAQENFGKALPVVAAGCMDGSVMFVGFGTGVGGMHARLLTPSTEVKCSKYIKGLAWAPSAPLLAVASADGTVIVAKVSNLQDSGNVTVDVVEKLQLTTTVESICFAGNFLIAYARDTPYLSYFDLDKQFEHTKVNLNRGSNAAVCGGFEDHVSFAVMDMQVSPNGKYLALATDTSRNIIVETKTGKHIRNLYGHANDGFSNPKIGWSSNGQYVMGNTQEGGMVCVWDVSSTDIVKRLEGHASPIRGFFSSKLSDTLVTTSFDKQTRIWLAPAI